MKKLIALLVAVALLVSASATVFALSGMDSKTESGNIKIGNKTYHYDCVLRASTAQFSASMAYDNYDVYITCKAKPFIYYLGEERVGAERSATGQGSVSVSGDNSLSSTKSGPISWVRGTYYIRSETIKVIDIT